ncbi:MAG: GerW family sporulation protein [Fidelibacterota bacterium]
MDLEKLISTVISKLREVVKTETVVGEPIQAEKAVIIPVSKVTIGFGAGGGEGKESKKGVGSGGGAGGGATIEPVAFIVVSEGKASLLPLVAKEATLAKVIDLIPDIINKLKKEKKKKEEQKEK